MKPFCNDFYSLCCLIISCWGIIQLPIMGLFLYLLAPAFVIDFEHVLDELKPPFTSEEYYANVVKVYHGAAINCLIAAAVNVFVALISFWQGRLLKEQEQLAISSYGSPAPRSSISRPRSRSRPSVEESRPPPEEFRPLPGPSPRAPPRSSPRAPPRPSPRPAPGPAPGPSSRRSPGPAPTRQSPRKR